MYGEERNCYLYSNYFKAGESYIFLIELDESDGLTGHFLKLPESLNTSFQGLTFKLKDKLMVTGKDDSYLISTR